MSFRLQGGLKYAARNNFVTKHYSTAGYLGITSVVGQAESMIMIASDLSGNIGSNNDRDISGNFSITRDITIGNKLDVSGNVVIGGDVDVAGDVDISGTLEVRGSSTFDSSLNIVSPPIMTYSHLIETLSANQIGYSNAVSTTIVGPFDVTTTEYVVFMQYTLLPGIYHIALDFIASTTTNTPYTYFYVSFGPVSNSNLTNAIYTMITPTPWFTGPYSPPQYYVNAEMTLNYQVQTEGTYGFAVMSLGSDVSSVNGILSWASYVRIA